MCRRRFLGSLCVLALVGMTGCTGGPRPTPVGDKNKALFESALDGIVKQDMEKLKKMAESVNTRLEREDILQSQADLLIHCVGLCEKGDWDAAAKLIRDSLAL